MPQTVDLAYFSIAEAGALFRRHPEVFVLEAVGDPDPAPGRQSRVLEDLQGGAARHGRIDEGG